MLNFAKVGIESFYGFINAIMSIPIMISFTNIIYRDEAYEPYLPTLVKLMLFSGVIHQVCFNIFSSLDFAVGQVQDAGLIFLSSMSTYIAITSRSRGYSDDEMISTAVWVLSGGTALLGLAIVVLAKLRLATIVQYLPMPVVGGYLAFIGFYCGEAGIGYMAGIDINGLSDWKQLNKIEYIYLILPGIVFGLLLVVWLRKSNSVAVFPSVMITMVAAFYIFVALSGTTVADAREAGWLDTSSNSDASLPQMWKYFQPSKFRLDLVPRIIPTWIGMYLVVAFSSSLDVAAIEMELCKPLDYNNELRTVGISNFFSGIFGGYTGSYIFSQTIFSLRVGIKTRLNGWMIAIVELLFVVAPFNLVAYVPKFFFGSLLVWIAFDLMFDWLIVARKKMHTEEYVVAISTFMAILIVGVEMGMVIGIMLAALSFACVYAASGMFVSVVPGTSRHSSTVRTFEERRLLNEYSHQMIVLSLQGYIFFGTAVGLLEQVKEHIRWTEPEEDQGEATESDKAEEQEAKGDEEEGIQDDEEEKLIRDQIHTSYDTFNAEGGHSQRRRYRRARSASDSSRGSVPPAPSTNIKTARFSEALIRSSSQQRQSPQGNGSDVPSYMISPVRQPWGSPRLELQRRNSSYMTTWSSNGSGYVSDSGSMRSSPVLRRNGDSSLLMEESGDIARTMSRSQSGDSITSSRGEEKPDLATKDAVGIDATAARSCFLMLKQLLTSSGVMIVFCGMPEKVARLLESHGVVSEEDHVFDDIEDALEFCEEQILQDQSNTASPVPGKEGDGMVGIDDRRKRRPSYYTDAVSRRHRESLGQISMSGMILVDDRGTPKMLEKLRNLFEDYLSDDSKMIAGIRKTSDDTLYKYFKYEVLEQGEILYGQKKMMSKLYFLMKGTCEMCIHSREGRPVVSSCTKVSTGGVVGELNMFLKYPEVSAQMLTRGAAWTIDQDSLDNMEEKDPILCLAIQKLLLKSLALGLIMRQKQ